MQKKLLRGISLVCFFALSLMPSFAEDASSTTTPVQMTVTLRLQGKNKRMPEVSREDIIVRQGKERVQVTGWTPVGSERDRQIASLVAERIPDGATLQAGIGAAPDLVLGMLKEHHELGVHTELFGDGFLDLIECGALTGTRKLTHRNKVVTTSALGSKRLYDLVDENPGVEFHPVDYTNDPTVIAREPLMTAINATLEVDFLGQCASESLGSEYMSSSGGQPDYARGAVMAEHGQAFIVLHSTAGDDAVSRIVPQLQPGAAVTTFKNIVDKVVTEYGVAELRGRSIAERTRRLIGVAHPRFREQLTAEAKALGYLRT